MINVQLTYQNQPIHSDNLTGIVGYATPTVQAIELSLISPYDQSDSVVLHDLLNALEAQARVFTITEINQENLYEVLKEWANHHDRHPHV